MPDCLPKTSMTVPHKSSLTYFKTNPMLISAKHTFDDWLVLLAPSLPQHTEHRDNGVYKTTRHQGPWIPLAHILPYLSGITPAFPQSTTPLQAKYNLVIVLLKIVSDSPQPKHDPLNYHPYFLAAPRVKPLLTWQTCCPFKLSLSLSLKPWHRSFSF